METIKEILKTEGCSCVIKNKNENRKFHRKGVIDAFELLKNEPAFLKGAYVADKIIGKGAATIFVLGGISSLYTNIISEKALEVFSQNGIQVEYDILVPNIINRDKTGFCPVETLCAEENDLERNLSKIDRFIKKMITKNK